MVLALAGLLGLLAAPLRAEEPRWRELPPEPRYETDFTAYTVGRGRWRLGPLHLDYGLLDELQLGSAPLLWLVGPNGRAKVTAIQEPRWDVSFEAEALRVDASERVAADRLVLVAWPLTLTGSWVLHPRLSLHAGVQWQNADVQGSFDLDSLGEALARGLGLDLSEDLAQWLEGQGALYGGAHLMLVQARFGLDYRLNRRDSIVWLVRSWSSLRGRVDAGYATEDESVQAGAAVRIREPLGDRFRAVSTLSWQFTWPRFRLRVGLPLSTPGVSPVLWIDQAFELYWLL